MKKKIVSFMTVFTLIMSFTVFGMSNPGNPQEMTVLGQGYIAAYDDSTTDILIDVTAPADFLWYADNNTTNGTTYDIRSGIYPLENNSKVLNLMVEVLGYEKISGDLDESKVILNLTGPLAEDGYGQDIFGGDVSYGICSEILASKRSESTGVGKSKWNIGFAGEYTEATLPAVRQISDYKLLLEFTASSISE